MSLNHLMTRFEGTDAQHPPFRIAILTEPGGQSAHQSAVAKVLSIVAETVAPSVQISVFSVGHCTAFQSNPLFTVTPVQSGPAGQSWNAGLQLIRAGDWDAVLLLSPNSVVSAKTLQTYARFMRSYFRCLSSFDQYYIDETGTRVAFWTGFTGPKQGISTFNGRCIHRQWLDTIDWQLWPPEAKNAEEAMQPKLDGLKAIAAHSGEHRIFGCIAHELAILSVRDSADGFFEQSGESAQTSPVDRTEFFSQFFPNVDQDIFDLSATATEPAPDTPLAAAVASTTKLGQPHPAIEADETSTTGHSEAGTMDPAAAQRLSQSIASAVSALAHTLGDQPAPAASPTATADPEPTDDEPRSEQQWIEQGEAAFGAGDVSMAELCFQQALNLNPLSAVAHNDLAVTYHTLGKLEAAERHYLKAVSFDAQSADAFVGLVTLAVDAGQVSLALRYVAQGLRRDPGHDELLARAQQLSGTDHADAQSQEVNQ
ncbi:MAG: tetratricopeptide repeat protein [Myxococcota bacterium]|nr:tetratricopeptide repeat protein [Myxococcota bacterium]